MTNSRCFVLLLVLSGCVVGNPVASHESDTTECNAPEPKNSGPGRSFNGWAISPEAIPALIASEGRVDKKRLMEVIGYLGFAYKNRYFITSFSELVDFKGGGFYTPLMISADGGAMNDVCVGAVVVVSGYLGGVDTFAGISDVMTVQRVGSMDSCFKRTEDFIFRR